MAQSTYTIATRSFGDWSIGIGRVDSMSDEWICAVVEGTLEWQWLLWTPDNRASAVGALQHLGADFLLFHVVESWRIPKEVQ